MVKKISVLTSLYNCEHFLLCYLKALLSIEGKNQIEVLLLHNAPTERELEIIQSCLPKLDFVRHIIIPEREGLYATWNRGIKLSEGEYITVWNVDDVRFPDSILQQAEELDKNPQAAVAYGDIWISDEYGVCGSVRTHSPQYKRKKDFMTAFHISCFPMWRKSIHSVIGYFDEQFKCSADFDFQIRAVIHFPFVKTADILGIYLENQPHKLSANGWQGLENNIIHLRYGAYQHLNVFRIKSAKKHYQQKVIRSFEEEYPFTEKTQFGSLYKGMGLIIAIFRSAYRELRQTAKKIIYPHEKK